MTDTQQPREVVAEDFAAVNSGSYAGEEWQARVDTCVQNERYHVYL